MGSPEAADGLDPEPFAAVDQIERVTVQRRAAARLSDDVEPGFPVLAKIARPERRRIVVLLQLDMACAVIVKATVGKGPSVAARRLAIKIFKRIPVLSLGADS